MELAIEYEAEISAVVMRCACGDPDSHAGHADMSLNRPCPTPTIVDLGVISRGSSKDYS